jgi:acetyltransferase-like isoleucine patch superfamily enzyme
MRLELRRYNASELGQVRDRRFELRESVRRFLFWWFRHRPLPRVGSHRWHVLQHRQSLRSSVGTDLDERNWFFMRSLPKCGPELCVFPGSVFHYPLNVTIGRNVFINRNVTIDAPAPVFIGNMVLIGPGVIINSGNHIYRDSQSSIRSQGHQIEEINIDDDVWIGANSCILAGVRIGHGAVVGAGSVVTRDVSPFSVVAGVPASVIGQRTPQPTSLTDENEG